MKFDRRLIWAVGVIVCLSLRTHATQAQQAEESAADNASTATNKSKLRNIRVAVFDFDVLEGVDIKSAALTDQINTNLATIDHVTIVNRDQIVKIADEHKLSLSGVVDSAAATKLGNFLTANYVIVGRASRIGQTNYIVVKVIDVNTTAQTTVAAKVPTDKGVEALLEKLSATLEPQIRELQKSLPREKDTTFELVRNAAKSLVGKMVILDVAESHINRPLTDPAAQTAIFKRLKSLGMKVIIPKDPTDDWKHRLMETGKYGEEHIDFLLEGDGLSAFAANVQGMISCRARVELRLVPVPGNSVTVTERGAAANVDLVEALAAKAALEEAATNASDTLILQYGKTASEKSRKKK